MCLKTLGGISSRRVEPPPKRSDIKLCIISGGQEGIKAITDGANAAAPVIKSQAAICGGGG